MLSYKFGKGATSTTGGVLLRFSLSSFVYLFLLVCFLASQGNHGHTLPNGAHLDVVLNNLGNVRQKFLKLNEHLT